MQLLLVNHSRIRRVTLTSVFGLALFLVLTPLLPRAEQGNRITGTYTNMYYNQEGGDVLGEELKIVLTTQKKGYQGVLQFAEGEPSELIVVDIRISGNKLEFSIPENTPYAGQFTGTIAKGIIKGKFSFKGGGEETAVLKKGKSYWD